MHYRRRDNVVCGEEVIGGSDLLGVGVGELLNLSVARHFVYSGIDVMNCMLWSLYCGGLLSACEIILVGYVMDTVMLHCEYVPSAENAEINYRLLSTFSTFPIHTRFLNVNRMSHTLALYQRLFEYNLSHSTCRRLDASIKRCKTNTARTTNLMLGISNSACRQCISPTYLRRQAKAWILSVLYNPPFPSRLCKSSFAPTYYSY